MTCTLTCDEMCRSWTRPSLIVTRWMPMRDKACMCSMLPATNSDALRRGVRRLLTHNKQTQVFHLKRLLFQLPHNLVSWFNISFSTNISQAKSQGWRAIATQWRKASDILTSTLVAFLLSSHPKRKRDWIAHLNSYATAYNRGSKVK